MLAKTPEDTVTDMIVKVNQELVAANSKIRVTHTMDSNEYCYFFYVDYQHIDGRYNGRLVTVAHNERDRVELAAIAYVRGMLETFIYLLVK